MGTRPFGIPDYIYKYYNTKFIKSKVFFLGNTMSIDNEEEWHDYEEWKRQHEEDNPDINYPFLVNNFEQDIPATTTRIEVIDKDGKSYSNYDCDRIKLYFKDEGLTMRVVIDDILDDKPYS